MTGTVYSLCDYTGNTVRDWARAGYECVCFDLQHSIRADREERVGAGSIRYVRANVRGLGRLMDAAFVAAAPSCTDMSVSGARDFQKKGLRALIDSLELVEACRILCEGSDAPWMIEHPVSTLSTYWRKPDFMFDPADYGDGYTKKTCLWTGNGFVMPEKNRVPITAESYIHKMPPGPDRANLRSATPMGFARAVFEANSNRATARGAA